MLSGNKFILVLVLSDVYKLSGKFEIRFIHCCELKYSSDRNPVLCTESTEPVSGLTWHQNTSNASPSLCKTLVTYIGERSLIQWKSFTKNNSNIGPKHSKTYQGCSSNLTPSWQRDSRTDSQTLGPTGFNRHLKEGKVATQRDLWRKFQN